MTRLALLALASAPLFAADPYEPLMLYQGSWEAKMKGAEKPDRLVNDCARVGRFYTCQQTVNGKPGALLVFVPAENPGLYYTQAILPDGHANGRAELRIDGNTWTYSSKSEENGKTTYHRTLNTFTGRDKIHYEIADSGDGKTWNVTLSGDEQRTK